MGVNRGRPQSAETFSLESKVNLTESTVQKDKKDQEDVCIQDRLTTVLYLLLGLLGCKRMQDLGGRGEMGNSTRVVCQVAKSGRLSSMWNVAFLLLLPFKMTHKSWEPH